MYKQSPIENAIDKTLGLVVDISLVVMFFTLAYYTVRFLCLVYIK